MLDPRRSTVREPARAVGSARLVVAVGLGLLAVTALAGLLAVLATRKSEVELLTEVLAGSDRADAVWAFEKLKEIADDDLRELAARVDDPVPTPLRRLHWSGQGNSSHSNAEDDPFAVGEVMRFILRGRLRLHATFQASSAPPRAHWEEEVARFESTRRASDGAPLDPYSAPPRGFLAAPAVVPPSRNPQLAALAASREARWLFDVLRSGGKAEIAWALAILDDLPDEALDALLPEAASEAPVAVKQLSTRSGLETRGRFSAGEVVRVLLADRLGWGPKAPAGTPERLGRFDWLRDEDPRRAEHVEELLAAWKNRRTSAKAAADRRPP